MPILNTLPYRARRLYYAEPQGVASLALGYVLHWAFSPPLLNPKLQYYYHKATECYVPLT